MPKPHACTNHLSNFPVITCAVAIASILIFFTAGTGDLLQYERRAIGEGELWRLLTGHLAHWNFEHFFGALWFFQGWVPYVKISTEKDLFLCWSCPVSQPRLYHGSGCRT